MAAVAALVGLTLAIRQWRLPQITAAALGYTILLYGLASPIFGAPLSDVMAQTVAYLAPLVLFVFFYNRLDELKLWPVVAFTLVSAFAGVMQVAGVFAVLVDSLHLQSVVPRLGESALTGSRGLQYLTPEPSHAARVLLQAFALAVMIGMRHRAQGQLGPRHLVIPVVLLALLVGTLSGTALVFLLLGGLAVGVTLALTSIRKISPLRLLGGLSVSMVVLGASVGLVNLAREYGGSVRFLGLIDTISSSRFWSESTPIILASLGGKRLPSVVVGYAGLWDQPMGHGVASYIRHFDNLQREIGLNIESLPTRFGSWRTEPAHKPDSYLAQIALDIGVPGVVLTISLLGLCIQRARRRDDAWLRAFWSMRIAAVLVGAIMIVVYSSSALPVPWVLLSLASFRQDPRGGAT